MPQSRSDLERQLQDAKSRRDACAERLKQDGVEEAALKRQPAWRTANAACRQLTRRLGAVAAKEQLASDIAARKAAAAEESE
jgi:hypothetical protein